MSIVICQIIDDQCGLMIADRTRNYSSHRDTIDDNIYEIDDDKPVVMAGTGDASTIKDIINKTNDRSSEAQTLEDLTAIAGAEIRQNRLEKIDNRLESSYGVTSKDIARGFQVIDGEKVEINRKALEFYEQMVKGQDQAIQRIANTHFLMVGKMRSDEEIEIYATQLSDGTPNIASLPYMSVGSGHDYAQATLDEYYQGRPSQDKLDTGETLFSGLKAYTRAERGNQGVQGTANIKLIEDDDIKTAPYNNSVLMAEIVKGAENDFLREEFAQETLPELFKESEYEPVKEEMHEEAPDPEKFYLHLRGHNV